MTALGSVPPLPPRRADTRTANSGIFGGSDACYRLTYPEFGIVFELDRLRWDRHELHGELAVTCSIAGAKTVGNGILSRGTFNVSSIRGREERAKQLRQRANTNGQVEWSSMLEELSLRTIDAFRAGAPAVMLHTLPAPSTDRVYRVEGIELPAEHPTILFGDGGTGKSLIALWMLGRLAQAGKRTALFDWELEGQPHRTRLGQLFGSDMPPVLYARCDRALVHEIDRLRRIVRDERIDYCVIDSIAFATDGPPEHAESAAAYFRATRQLAIGSLHVAHITHQREESGQPKRTPKPFGSVFWHNGSRATWFVKRSEGGGRDQSAMVVGLYNEKMNLSARRPAVGLSIDFLEESIDISRTEITDHADLAHALPIADRVAKFLERHGARTILEITEALELDKQDSVKKALQRGGKKKRFQCITNTPDGMHRWAVVERQLA